jgi:superfamily I DNA and/or RNA helicase
MLRAATAGRVGVVDTVERLQGGERDTIIVSATASEPSAIASSADFILDLNRSNVAFSRVRHRLIVVCSATLLDHIPSDIEQYDNAHAAEGPTALPIRR